VTKNAARLPMKRRQIPVPEMPALDFIIAALRGWP
jgi:hypothetical protein